MIELPETYVLSEQINKTLVGKTIRSAVANAHPHGFAQYTGNPDTYNDKLAGKRITSSNPGTQFTCGGNIEVICEDMLLVLSTPVKYHPTGEKLPKSHQLLLEFDDGSHMSCSVQMWGCMFCSPVSENGLPEDYTIHKSPTPYEDDFDKAYFDSLWRELKPSLSVKAFLTTEQRIPGFGNGVLHDVLWNARIHPKRKLQTLTEQDMETLFQSVKSTLKDMRDNGGRNTEKDLFNKAGGYQTILSNKTLNSPCPNCGGGFIRQAYLGGNIYFCPECQKIIPTSSELPLCQSCSMPMTKSEDFGTLSDGNQSHDYCHHCYKNGALRDGVTIDELIADVQKLITIEAAHPDLLSTPLLKRITEWMALDNNSAKIAEISDLCKYLIDGQDCDFTGTPWEKEWLSDGKVCHCIACVAARKCISDIKLMKA